MNLNLKYYKNDIEYNKIENEEEIISEYIDKYKEEEFEKILEKESKIETVFALSEIRKNIVSWYPFNKEASVLEIGAGLGELTGYFCDNVKKVISVEFSKSRGEAIAKRHQDKENLEVIVGKLQDIKFKEKFDYITLIGILEYAPIIYNTGNSFVDLLKYLKTLLNENGKILIATNNKFGMRNWAVSNQNEDSLNYNAVSTDKEINESKILGKKRLEEILKEADLGTSKYYYPLPDYKYTNVIFTKEFLPNTENINRNITLFTDDDVINFHENDAYKQLLKNDKDKFEFFANSFFIEIAENLEENNIKYASFSNLRKSKYRIKTIIQGDKVYKYPANEKAKKHIRDIKKNIKILKEENIDILDSYDKEKIISNYVENAETYDKHIMKAYKENGIDKVIEFINEFKKEVISKFEKSMEETNVFDKYKIEYEPENVKKLNFIKSGFWDLTFQNCFLIDGKFNFYDQEWREENVPLEYILYRNIIYFDELKRKENEDKILEELNILEYKELFEKLDSKIQSKIRNDAMFNLHIKEMKNVRGMYLENERLKNENANIEKTLEEEKAKNQNSAQTIQEMQDTINIQLAKINFIESSRGWRLIVKIRNIFSHLKFWKKKQ